MMKPTYKELHEWLEHAIWREDELKDKVKKLEKALDEAKKAIKTLGLMAEDGSGSERYANAELNLIDKIIKGEHNVEQ